MRFFFTFFLVIIFLHTGISQEEPNIVEDKVFKVVEEMPRFPGCEVGVMTRDERKKCAENNMLRFIYGNIKYPDTARMNGTEGRVVLQFVVNKEGLVTDTKILRDIGDGCGEEALRVINILRDQKVTWVPGKQRGQPVKVQYTLPVSFKIQEELPYTVINGDSIYLNLDTPVSFNGGEDALNIFLATETMYPESGLDSCLIGSMKSDIIVRPNGSVQLLETIDFSNLGTDFLFEVIKLVPKLENRWTPATYDGKPVTTIYPIRIEFRPTSEGCKSIVEKYELTEKSVQGAVDLHDKEDSANGLIRMNDAIEKFPNNTEWLYFRGIMHMSLKDNEAACADFQKIEEILPVPWYEKWISMICKL